MPDIDIDFSVKGRERVIQYVADKYGRESVAQIITFGRMYPRAATRDAARVLGFDYGAGDRIAKLIPEPDHGPLEVVRRVPQAEEADLRRVYDTEPEARQIIEVASGLEGIVRNSSIHAAAVVIADRPLTDIVPLQLAEDKGASAAEGERAYRTVTQYPMKPIEEIGLLKMDFLGLRNLDVIEAASTSSSSRPAGGRTWPTLPLDDAKTYEMLARGRLGRRVPVRVRRHARRPQEGASHGVQRHRRARRALPARARCASSTPTRATSATPTRSSYIGRAAAARSRSRRAA